MEPRQALKKDTPQFDPRQSAQGRSRIPAVAGYEVIDQLYGRDHHQDAGRHAAVPDRLDHDVLAGAVGEGRQELGRVRRTPSGTGPWKLDNFVPRERAELVPNRDYWDKARVPKLDKLVLLPLAGSECPRRRAALGPGRLDRGAAAGRDRRRSKSAGFQIVTNAYPHNWTWHLSRAEGSPWNDIRVRKAANLAVDRDGLKELLGRPDDPGRRLLPARPPVVRQSDLQAQA